MKELSFSDFSRRISSTPSRVPLYGQIELTYRCPCQCIHCYCIGQEKKECDPAFWKTIFDQVRDLGGLELAFTGGDPLLYPNFLEVYRFARDRGFLINIFTSGCLITPEILDGLQKEPPVSVEITLNSLKAENYDHITGTKGMLKEVLGNIEKMGARKIPLVLKCNGLKENREEILDLKRFSEKVLGKGKFRFDSFIFPRLDGSLEPVKHRLAPEEILAIEKSDRDMMAQRSREADQQMDWVNPKGLYHCNSWRHQYFISPEGILQFCHLTKECATDLKQESFKKGFDRFSDVLKANYQSQSQCIDCELRKVCYQCPARAFLETGDPELPVAYYCELAKARVASSMNHFPNS